MQDDHAQEQQSGQAPERPGVVSVTGTEATDDREVKMLAGETGAALPTGHHERSLAVPDQTTEVDGSIMPALLIGGLLLVLLVIVLVLLL